MENNYYDTLIKDIKLFLENNDYSKAAQLINEELKAPYIPQEVEEHLVEFNQIITRNLANNLKDSFLVWNVDKVAEVMQDTLDQELHLIAFDALRGLNARLILPMIRAYFLNNNIKDEYKTFLIMILLEQKVDEEFLIYKDNGKVELSINPATFDTTGANNFLANLELQLELLVNMKNPSLYTVCKSFANTYFYNVFPNFELDTFAINDIVAFIVIHSKKALGLEWESGVSDLLDYDKEKVAQLFTKYQAIF